MLVSLQLFNTLKFFLIILALVVSQGCSSEEKTLTSDSLQKPEELAMFVKKGVSKENQKIAEGPYIGAMKNMEQNDWAAAAKGFGIATLFYPTAKSLIGLSEAKAKFYTQNRLGKEVAIRTLKRVENYLKGAIAVDSIQKKMTQSETEEVKSDIVCINEFLKSRVKKDNCKYVNYVYLVPKEE